MRPAGSPGTLFEAFSRIAATAFRSERLVSCPTLSKAPNYGQVLRRFLLQTPDRPENALSLIRISLRYILTNGLHYCFMLLTLLYARLLAWKLPLALRPKNGALQEKPLFFIDTFAVLPRVAASKAFQDLYLPGLAEEAVACGHEVMHIYRLYGSRNPLTLWKACKVFAKQGNGLTEIHLLNFWDWLLLLRHALIYPISLYRLIRSLRHHPPASPEYHIHRALIHTAGQCILIGEARRLAARRLGILLAYLPFSHRQGSNVSPFAIAAWHENQTLNKAFYLGLAQAREKTGAHVPVTGAQLFIWPDTLLNNHPDDEEISLRLTPDRVLVNGPYFLPESTRQHYAVGPSLRYGDLFGNLPDASRSDRHADTLLVLLSYHPEEIRRVLSLALPLAQQNRTIVYKFHPATRPEAFTDLLPLSPVFAETSLKTALQKAGAVLGSGSGSLAEAAAQGIVVLNAEDPSGTAGLGLNYLPEFGKNLLWFPVRQPQDAQRVLDSLSSRSPVTGEQIFAFRDLLFTEPTPARIRETFRLC